MLVDLNGTLVVNLNDASDRGWKRFVRKIINEYDVSFLLKLSGYGDAEMIHCKQFENRSLGIIRHWVPFDSRAYSLARKIYYRVKEI